MVVAKVLIKKLKKDGWEVVSQKGSHIKFKKAHVCVSYPTIKEIFLWELYQILSRVLVLNYNQTHI